MTGLFQERILEETSPDAGVYDVIVDGSATREEWLAARSEGCRIGSSDVPILLGLAGDRASPYALWAERLGYVAPGTMMEGADEELLEAGQMLEPVAAEWWRRIAVDHGWSPRIERWQSLLVSREHPWASATPDFHLFEPERGFGVLEVKVVGEYMRAEWEGADAPEKYVAQLAHQLIVTGRPWGVLCAMVGGRRPRAFEYRREDLSDMCGRIIEAGRRFVRCLEKDTPPPTDGTVATARAQKARWPRPEQAGSPLLEGEALERAAALDDEYVRVRDALKVLERRKAEIEAAVRELIADGQELHITGHSTWSWKAYERAERVLPASTVRRLTRRKARARRR